MVSSEAPAGAGRQRAAPAARAGAVHAGPHAGGDRALPEPGHRARRHARAGPGPEPAAAEGGRRAHGRRRGCAGRGREGRPQRLRLRPGRHAKPHGRAHGLPDSRVKMTVNKSILTSQCN